MIKMWIYQSKSDNTQGFTIQENIEFKYHKDGTRTKTGKKVFNIWHDQYEGGYAYDSDWFLMDDETLYPNLPKSYQWNSFDEAYKWLVDNYGEVIEIGDDNNE